MPKQYGSYVTAWRRLKRWSEDSVWDMIVNSFKDDFIKTGNSPLELLL